MDEVPPSVWKAGRQKVEEGLVELRFRRRLMAAELDAVVGRLSLEIWYTWLWMVNCHRKLVVRPFGVFMALV